MAVFLFGFSAVAQNTYGTYSNSQDPNNFGTTHNYNVLFRSNGEAIVLDSFSATNDTDQILKNLVFKLPPGLVVTDVKAWQYFPGRKCFERQTRLETSIDICDQQSKFNNAVQNNPSSTVPMQNDYYSEFAKVWGPLQVTSENGQLKLSLAMPLNPKSAGVFQAADFVLRFRAAGYAKEGLFGSMDFDFKTLAADDEVKAVNVNINTDADLYFKGKKSTVSSQTANALMAEPQMVAGSDSSLGMSKGLGYYGDNGFSGSFSRSAQFLAPGETLTVSGKYATTWFGYYYSTIFWVIFWVIFGISLLVLAILYGRKYLSTSVKNNVVTKPATTKNIPPVVLKPVSDIMIVNDLVWGVNRRRRFYFRHLYGGMVKRFIG